MNNRYGVFISDREAICTTLNRAKRAVTLIGKIDTREVKAIIDDLLNQAIESAQHIETRLKAYHDAITTLGFKRIK